MEQDISPQMAESDQISISLIAEFFDTALDKGIASYSGTHTLHILITALEVPQLSKKVHVSDRLLLDYKEAAALLSMTEQALRDLVHKGQGPETVRRGKRVCFTYQGLKTYVDTLPREQPYQGIIETINRTGSKPMSAEERRVFGAS